MIFFLRLIDGQYDSLVKINSSLIGMHGTYKMNNFWQSTTTSLTNHLQQSNIKSLIFQEKMVQKIQFVPAVRCQRDLSEKIQ